MYVFFRRAARRYFILLKAVDGEAQVYLCVYLRARICALRGLNAARIYFGPRPV